MAMCQAKELDSISNIIAREISWMSDAFIEFKASMMIVSSDYRPYLFAGPRRICSKRALLGLRWFLRNRDTAFGKNGGDDETRTRDLCRDSKVV
jgi:hypothetical protein